MKDIKRLGITTIEGLEVRNLQRFPSMEWGDEGGLQAEVYLNNKLMGTLYQAGDGGCANFTYNSSEDYTELAKAALTFLKRVDKNYGPNSEYDWLKNKKTCRDIGDDDIEAVVTNIEEYYDDVKEAAKSFRAGYKTVVALKSVWQTDYLQYGSSNVTDEDVSRWLQDNDKKGKYTHYRILKPVLELTTL